MARATPKEAPKFLRIAGAAAYIGVPTQTMQRMVRDRAVVTYRPGGRPRSRVYIATRDLDELMSAARRPATAGPLAERGGK